MPDRLYRKVELVGTSPSSSDDAIRSAVAKASASIGAVDWFEVTEVRGRVDDGAVHMFQVSVIVGVRIEG